MPNCSALGKAVGKEDSPDEVSQCHMALGRQRFAERCSDLTNGHHTVTHQLRLS